MHRSRVRHFYDDQESHPALTKYKKKDQDEVSTVRIHQGSFHSDRLAISIEEQEERGQKKARRMVAKSHV
jgi:hypothetical protein